MSRSRFFIALLPPQAIQDYATKVIQELSDRYHTGVSKAPPHITLHPPFERSLAEEPALEECLNLCATQHGAVPVTLSRFGAFAPRVIYINVLKTPELLTLQANLSSTLKPQLACDAVSAKVTHPQKYRPFAPHLTVASRNITRSIFEQAWAELQPRSVEFEWVSDRLTLLVHDGYQWRVKQDFPLSGDEVGGGERRD